MIGIIPAAGSASRIFGIPKMLLPTPSGVLIDTLADRMLMACDHLYTGANSRVYGMLAARLSSPSHSVFVANTTTMSQTVRLAERHVKPDDTVLFGMPDSTFEDDQAFVKLAAAIQGGADVAVGVFRVRNGQHQRGGMVDLDGDRVRAVIDKPEKSGLAWIWGVLAWRPEFWPLIDPETPHVGYALPRAIAAGMDVRRVILNGPYWDCGTPSEYFDCIAYQRQQQAA